MEHPILSSADHDDDQAPSECDIRAMLSMIDYLIARAGRIDAMSARCLIMARQSLATFSAHPRQQ